MVLGVIFNWVIAILAVIIVAVIIASIVVIPLWWWKLKKLRSQIPEGIQDKIKEQKKRYKEVKNARQEKIKKQGAKTRKSETKDSIGQDRFKEQPEPERVSLSDSADRRSQDKRDERAERDSEEDWPSFE